MIARTVEPPRFQAARKKRRYKTRVALAALVLLVVAGGVGFRMRSAPVTTSPITRGTAVEAVYATGTVEPFDRVLVKARASGIVDLKVREGATVKKGDLLAIIDAPALAHDLARGKSDLAAASKQAGARGPQLVALEAQARAIQADLNTARSERDRSAKLAASGSVPQSELDRMTDKVNAIEAQLQANTAQQDALRIDLSARQSGASETAQVLQARYADTEVRAPIDGVVLSRLVDPGEVAMINMPLFKVGTADNLVLECAIDEADIGRVVLGQPVAVSLYAFAPRVSHGTVFEILPEADRAKKSFLTKVRLTDAPAGLRSGMTAEVNVIIQQRPDALLVRAEAIDSSGRAQVVVDGHIELRTPTLGVRDMLHVEVKDGLAEGEQVVIGGGEALREGARVKATVAPFADAKSSSGSSSRGMSL
jgi:multidrug efflux pump subunit AcrA (membrane-fusion protein)